MIRINQLKIPIFEVCPGGSADVDPSTGGWTKKAKEREQKLLYERAAKMLKCRVKDIRKLRILRRSTDARDKNDILFVYSLDLRLHDSVTGPTAETELQYIQGLRNRSITQETKKPFAVPKLQNHLSENDGTEAYRPVIVGSGPCGLFAAVALCESGLKPIILERGGPVEERTRKTDLFFESGKLDPDCNIQFGEGGAGTFSDGKLNTSIKDQGGFIEYVLRTFVRFGADESILYDQKPHIGTDVLVGVICSIRRYVEEAGGEYRFHSRFDGLVYDDQAGAAQLKVDAADGRKVSAVLYTDLKTGKRGRIDTRHVILATGHSARDTYEMLHADGIYMEPKAFAVGVRVQHPQELVDRALYGAERLEDKAAILGPSPYKLTHQAENGRSIYSFCMCPGGYVVISSSEEGRLCINGMSYHRRDSGTANSALIVNVTPDDYMRSDDPLSGLSFQRGLEEAAYQALDGIIPYETYGEFKADVKEPSGIWNAEENADPSWERFSPCFKGYAAAADVRGMLPGYVAEAVLDGMKAFARTIPGYDDPRAVIAGVEARTSSPVRITRTGERLAKLVSGGTAADEASAECKVLCGLYPAGEGAGYAGGITSAAVDGIRTALAIIEDMNQYNGE